VERVAGHGASADDRRKGRLVGTHLLVAPIFRRLAGNGRRQMANRRVPAEPADLMMLPKYQAYARLLIEGQPSRPFSVRTLAPPRRPIDPERAEIIPRVSRKRHTHPVTVVPRTRPLRWRTNSSAPQPHAFSEAVGCKLP
jgi:hypothetical protein